jgi:alpha-ketoglutarate-dependent taurine dioxygenase
MRRAYRILLTLGAAAIVATAASAAYAQASQSTPSGWNYEIKDGKRVPKAERKVNADGSWREEYRQGSCVTIKEKTASGDYKESRRCD